MRHERRLSSFAPEVITKAHDVGYGWYAVIDTGPHWHPSYADFSTFGPDEERARRLCALKIQGDYLGVGKFAPHAPICDEYAMKYKIIPYWAEKEIELCTKTCK